MKHKSILLLCLLVGPALARPNTEPIYRRSDRNPLEVTEELIPTTNTLPPVTSDNEDHQTSTGSSSSPAATSAAPATTPVPSTTASPTPAASTPSAAPSTVQDYISSQQLLFKRPESPLKTKIGTSGYVVSTSTKILTSANMHAQKKGVSSEGKANDQIVTYDNFASHAGVAEPMSEEDYHKELNKINDKVRIRLLPTTTTPREGLSTWVLLSESNSVTSTESKKEIVSTTKRPLTSTTRRPATTSARKPMTTPRRRSTTTTTTTTTVRPTTSAVNDNAEKINKFMNRIKIAMQEGLKPKNVTMLKKPKKPVTTTTTTTTTTTAAPTTTTTEVAEAETSLGTIASVEDLTQDDNSIETSTFLVLEPKDALFDLPEDRSPTKVSKKPTKATRKTNAGTKKKPATKKTKKPEEKDSGLIKTSEKRPAQKPKPVTTQIMNYLSREVMPTVGVGLVGLVLTAGLASYFFGTPLTAALRRSDETNRKDDIYYSNFEDYATQDGQNEEEVFGKLIAGMPDRSYYRNNIRRRISQPPPPPVSRTGHQYGNYHVQSYSANKYPHISYRSRPAQGPMPQAPAPAYAGTPEMYATYNRNVQAKSHNEFFYNTPPSFYTKPSSPVFVTSPAPYTTSSSTLSPLTSAEPDSPEEDMSEQEPELLPNPAAYTAEHSPEHHAQFVVGSVYAQDNSMIDIITSAPVPEHGPRRKRDVVASEENELDNEIGDDEDVTKQDIATSTSSPASVSAVTTEEAAKEGETSTEGEKVETSSEVSTPTSERPISWSDLIRNTVEMKMVMGINLLQQVTNQFQRYLNGVQQNVEQHFNRTVVHQ